MQGFRLAQDIKLTFRREDILARLRENQARHIRILREANKGYLEQAQAALEAKLEEVKAGELVTLSFSLSRPVSHATTYVAMISMLEATSDEMLVLTMEQQQAFMCDRWDWQEQFLTANSGYSGTARSLR